MVPKTCSIPECERTGRMTRGWCNMHYQRWRYHGDPLKNLFLEMPSVCSVSACGRDVLARGLCQRHYARQSRTGSPTGSTAVLRNAESRFWEKVRKTESCWVWTGSLNRGGYGRFSMDGKAGLSHRVSYEWANGSIEPGLDIDHKCHNRACVRPSHLRPANRKQNVENHSGPYRTNKSGVRGVHWHPQSKKWRAVVRHYGKTFQVGMFDRLVDAGEAVVAKRNELHTFNDRDRIPA